MIAFLIFYWIFSFILILSYILETNSIIGFKEHITVILISLIIGDILLPILIAKKL